MAKYATSLSSSLTGAEKLGLLNCRRLSARLDVAQTAVLLNFGEHDIRFLNNSGLLTALGKPVPNAPKYFATVEITALAENREWLEKATKTIISRWREKNAKIKLGEDFSTDTPKRATSQRLKVA